MNAKRREGYLAFIAGKSRETNPYANGARYQWFAGYGQAESDYAERLNVQTS